LVGRPEGKRSLGRPGHRGEDNIKMDLGRRGRARIAQWYSTGLDDWGFKSQQGLEIFLFTTVSRLALGPTQPPIQWVPEALPWG
jgi:hypothetical protein